MSAHKNFSLAIAACEKPPLYRILHAVAAALAAALVAAGGIKMTGFRLASLKKLAPVLFAIFAFAHPVAAESIRGPVTAVIHTDSEESSARFTAGDLIVVQSSSINAMSAALQFELTIPEAVRNYRGA